MPLGGRAWRADLWGEHDRPRDGERGGNRLDLRRQPRVAYENETWERSGESPAPRTFKSPRHPCLSP
jgi:hypothetical protein